ncbi:conserved hypothetical protein, secreted [Candidatus Magnetomorum sp. HK-1]|nr:conserved hypothetical protein, secreted [Candidatus Magnetomorum sp. HK-1]
MKNLLRASLIFLIGSLIISAPVHSDEMSRQAFETAYTTYHLDLSARLLEQAIKSYDPIANPQGASNVLSAFDQLVNSFVQANLIVGNYMNVLKLIYPDPHPIYTVADDISSQLNIAVQSATLLQTVSKGASNAGLASYSKIDDIKDCVSNSGAAACVSSIISNLKALGVPEDELTIVQQDIYQNAQQASMAAIYKKARDSNIIANSDACQASAGAIANIATHVDGAATIAMGEFMYKGTPFSVAFASALSSVMADSKKNPKSFEEQQTTYAITFSPIFAATFATLINQSAISPFNTPIHTGAQQTNAEKLIEGAKLLSQGIAQIILPGSTNIADAMNYATVKNSGLQTKRKIELQDSIYTMQKLSGVK